MMPKQNRARRREGIEAGLGVEAAAEAEAEAEGVELEATVCGGES